MERSQILDMMGALKLFGMRGAYDEIMASGIKRQHEPPRIVGNLLQSEIAEKLWNILINDDSSFKDLRTASVIYDLFIAGHSVCVVCVNRFDFVSHVTTTSNQ